MKISEELERQEKEATKVLEKADDYHKHPEYEHLQIGKVVHEGEETGSSKSGEEEDVGTKYIVQTCDANLEEELAQKLKDVGEEMEKPLPEEGRREGDKMEESTDLPTGK